MSGIDLHKLADVIFRITQKPIYITLTPKLKGGLGLAFRTQFLSGFSIKMLLI